MRRTLSFVTAGVVGGLLIIWLGAWWFTASTWFVWHLLPPDATVQVAVAWQSVSRADVFDAMPEAMVERWPLRPEQVYALGWARDSAGRQVWVVVPTIRQQVAAPVRLRAVGWRVERHGAALRVWQGGALDVPSFGQAAVRAATSLAFSRWPVAPVAVLAADRGLPSLSEPILAVVLQQPRGWRGLVLLGDEQVEGKRIRGVSRHEGELALALPGHLFTTLPKGLRQGWEVWLADRLGFERVRPDFLEGIFPDSVVTTVVLEGEAGWGIYGNDPKHFVAEATRWVEDEERHGRVVTRAFRLPDGTLGREQVPGERAAVFADQPDEAGCLAPVAGKNYWWLCAGPEWAVLATSREVALRLLADQTAQWQMSMVTAVTGCKDSTAWWCRFSSVALSGRPERVLLDLRW